MNREKLDNAIQAIVVLQEECRNVSEEWNAIVANITYGLEELGELQTRAERLTDFDANDMRMMIEAMEEIEAASIPEVDLCEV